MLGGKSGVVFMCVQMCQLFLFFSLTSFLAVVKNVWEKQFIGKRAPHLNFMCLERGIFLLVLLSFFFPCPAGEITPIGVTFSGLFLCIAGTFRSKRNICVIS